MNSPIEFTSPEESKKEGYVIMICGPAGSGKTWFGSRFPNSLLIDLDGGSSSAAGGQCKLAVCKNIHEFDKLLYWLMITPKIPGIDIVEVDTLSTLQSWSMSYITEHAAKKKGMLPPGSITADVDKVMETGLNHKGGCNDVLIQVMQKLKCLPYTVVIFVHEIHYSAQKSTTTGLVEVGPDIQPGALNQISRRCDVIGRLYYREERVEKTGEIVVQRYLQVGPEVGSITKCRAGVLPDVIKVKDDTPAKMLELIFKKEEKVNGKQKQSSTKKGR